MSEEGDDINLPQPTILKKVFVRSIFLAGEIFYRLGYRRCLTRPNGFSRVWDKVGKNIDQNLIQCFNL